MTSLTGSIECSIAVPKRYLSVVRYYGCVGLETEYVVLMGDCCSVVRVRIKICGSVA